MARMARAVFPGIPHHVTQRGNGRALGAADVLARLETESGRVLAAGKRGPRAGVVES